MLTTRRRQWIGLAVLAAVVGAGLYLGARLIMATEPAGNQGRETPGPASVMYVVSGTARAASITVRNGTGGTEQIDAALPWRMTVAAEAGQFVYVSGQNDGATGTVRCAIVRGGQTLAQAQSEAAYGVAECSAVVK